MSLDIGASLCIKYKLTSQDLSSELEAFLLNNLENVKNITLENIGRLEQEIQKSRARKLAQSQQQQHGAHIPAAKKPKLSSDGIKAAVQLVEVVDSAARADGFKTRGESGAVVLKMNENVGKGVGRIEPSTALPLRNRAVVSMEEKDFDGILSRYRYMYSNLHDRARGLDRMYCAVYRLHDLTS